MLWASLAAQTVKNMSAMQETQVRSLSLEDALEKDMAPRCSVLTRESHGERSRMGCSPGVAQSALAEWLTHHCFSRSVSSRYTAKQSSYVVVHLLSCIRLFVIP